MRAKPMIIGVKTLPEAAGLREMPSRAAAAVFGLWESRHSRLRNNPRHAKHSLVRGFYGHPATQRGRWGRCWARSARRASWHGRSGRRNVTGETVRRVAGPRRRATVGVWMMCSGHWRSSTGTQAPSTGRTVGVWMTVRYAPSSVRLRLLERRRATEDAPAVGPSFRAGPYPRNVLAVPSLEGARRGANGHGPQELRRVPVLGARHPD